MKFSTLAVAVSLALGATLIGGCDRGPDRPAADRSSSSSTSGTGTTTPSTPSGSSSTSGSEASWVASLSGRCSPSLSL